MCPKLYFHNPMPHTCPDPEWNSTPYTCTDIVEGINPPNSVSQPLDKDGAVRSANAGWLPPAEMERWIINVVYI